jgi:2-oxoglutarate ferredoxin oxidoreductase subunit alpha
VKSILVVEMNAGQMFHDIKQIVKDNCMVDFYGRLGGILPYPDEIQSEIRRMIVEPLRKGSDPIKSWLNRLESIRSLETYGR